MSIRYRVALVAVIIIVSALCGGGRMLAAGNGDSESERILTEMRRLFNTKHEDSLYRVAAEYRQHNLQTGNLHAYYKGWQAEIMYDINFNHFYRAMKKTVEMSHDMKERDCGGEIYNATFLIGVIYSLQGNVELAKSYFKKAIDEAGDSDPSNLIQIYKDLANVEMDDAPREAMEDLDHAIKLIKNAGMKYEYSDAIGFKVIVAFAMQDWGTVRKTYDLYMKLQKEYGKEFSMTYYPYVQICRYTADGDYDKAIEWTERLTNIDKYRFKTKVYEISGDMAAAFAAQKEYIHAKDSVNSGIMVQELSNAANEIEMVSMKNKAEEARLMKKALKVTVVTAMAVILALVFIIRKRNGYLTSLRQKNNELEVLREKAEEAERMKASILKNMSHEVRTPLNIISGFTQIMSQTDFTLTAEERADIAARIEKSSNDIVRIINDLLYMSSKESSSYISRADTISCNEICRSAIYRYRSKTAEGVKMAFGSDLPDTFTVRTNLDGVSRILECLLENACKFTTEGHINMACRKDTTGKTVEISVTDTGCGIAKDDKDKVFDLFYKIDDNCDGLGIGLSLAQRIARQLGGSITLDTEYTDGARFVVSLPVEKSL